MPGPKHLDPYKDSLWRVSIDPTTGAKVREKSCPKCSKREGKVTYYPETLYGERTMARGNVEIEPWCPKCRK